ncbi:MAG TPA: tetratricopeptide repeat protein [Candidatus Binataceae bacterium]
MIGTAVDNGVNMVYRWREERGASGLIPAKSAGNSLTIASLTTIAGFAALIAASHRGISNPGWMLSAGVTFILAATLFLLPAIFELIGRKPERGETVSEPASEIPRRAAVAGHRGMLIVAAACTVVIAGAIPVIAAEPVSESARAESKQMLASAEKLILDSRKSDPPDSAKVREAIDKLHRAVQTDPGNDDAYVDLGFCYGLLRDGPTAVDMYSKAAKLNPSPANFKELADIYLRVGQPDQALMAANAGLMKDPRNARLYNAKGMALNDLTRFDEAAEAFQRAVDLDPSLTVARTNLDGLDSRPSGRGSITKRGSAASAKSAAAKDSAIQTPQPQ